MNTLIFIASQFASVIRMITPLGNGLINDTYLVATAAKPFVLQRINASVFPKPHGIMENGLAIQRHLQRQPTIRLQIPAWINTQAGEPYYQDDEGAIWRAQQYIEATQSLEHLRTFADAKQTGFALGHFHRLFSTLDPAELHDTLPGFHITPEYLAHYHIIAKQSANIDRDCAAFIEQHEALADVLEQAKRQGLLPIRVIHGDPKLNNFLFHQYEPVIVSLIDLDTVKPGLLHYDIGDCLRSCCHRVADDSFDLSLCEVILSHYLAETADFFTMAEYDFLYAAIQLIPFELGLRFYTDYLAGNPYFKVTDAEQNLRRAQQQFRLCRSIMAQASALKDLIYACQIRVQS